MSDDKASEMDSTEQRYEWSDKGFFDTTNDDVYQVSGRIFVVIAHEIHLHHNIDPSVSTYIHGTCKCDDGSTLALLGRNRFESSILKFSIFNRELDAIEEDGGMAFTYEEISKLKEESEGYSSFLARRIKLRREIADDDQAVTARLEFKKYVAEYGQENHFHLYLYIDPNGFESLARAIELNRANDVSIFIDFVNLFVKEADYCSAPNAANRWYLPPSYSKYGDLERCEGRDGGHGYGRVRNINWTHPAVRKEKSNFYEKNDLTDGSFETAEPLSKNGAADDKQNRLLRSDLRDTILAFRKHQRTMQWLMGILVVAMIFALFV